MNLLDALLAAGAVLFWGTAGFVDKLMTNQLGNRGLLFYLLGNLPSLVIS